MQLLADSLRAVTLHGLPIGREARNDRMNGQWPGESFTTLRTNSLLQLLFAGTA
jgi:hypothetical protein